MMCNAATWILSAFFAVLFFPAMAQPISVQSGEHADFSRLVVRLDGEDWSVTQTGRDVVLTFKGFDQGFDTSKVFDFIPRRRIVSVSSSADTLTLALGCDCSVAAFLDQSTYVVLDVAATAESLATNAIPIVESAPAATIVELSDLTDEAAPPNVAAISEVPRIHPPASQPFEERKALSPKAEQVLNDVQVRLTTELGTATHRGMLTAAPDPKKSQRQRPHIDTRVFYQVPEELPISGDAAEEGVALGPRTNLRIRTSRDLPETFRHLSDNIGNLGQICPADEILDIASWGNPEDFGAQIADARQGLYGEFDRIDPQVALGLARTYLHFGFGAEAVNILTLDPAVRSEAALLLDMANILDGGQPGADSAITALSGCEGDAAIWATLALPDPPRGALPNSEPALRGLNALPAHLRTILAPMMSRVLLAYGDPEGAAKALHSLDRLRNPLPAEATMALAEIDLSQGETSRGTQRLTEVVEDNAAQSPRALIALIDAKIRDNQSIDAKTAGLVAAYAQEYRNSELGPKLRRAYALALTDSGQFDAAFEMLVHDPNAVTISDHVALGHYMIGKLTKAADDITFLEYSFAQDDRTLSSLPATDLIPLANRLLVLGFAVRAEQSLALLPEHPLREDRQLLAARISLAMGKPFKALADLMEIETLDADILRADAKRLAGANDEAHQLYATANLEKDAAETAWLSENWRNLTPAGAATFDPTARLGSTPAKPKDPNTGMLAHAASLLEESAHARDVLQSLMDAQDLQLPSVSE